LAETWTHPTPSIHFQTGIVAHHKPNHQGTQTQHITWLLQKKTNITWHQPLAVFYMPLLPRVHTYIHTWWYTFTQHTTDGPSSGLLS
jgi:hypothetical protein